MSLIAMKNYSSYWSANFNVITRMKPNFNFHCIVLLQLLYLCAACEELYNTEMVPPEGAIVFDGVITNEPPPYFFCIK